ncbi:MAG TPA: bifunctional diaminohydroxyphosphoribosylaminopyrimidine deaminase/5-amino-6-(5-phosphoribosylamino)uracil reductase RibD [Bryobacteraceae bacterium]|jgi:diaminohydroxyphosphoribosylaminopyrimidine deaminase/5-amino-6-(5-phosphoribosylamino)uracil reductase|nr:bifunctional diaminohydroxyphosphoribosylaminopyrimidine deaminase/5-amino-6-(5-phosphoribosylamino)uracil reductase RibD [Bryobacteraceae bacterium]
MSNPWMDEALELARRGVGRASPNPAVGAVLVNGGEVVGRGYHIYAQVKHAEILALEQAGERARGATLYVTLEPCAHHGRTPPCSDALVEAGVTRVVAAMQDPNPLVSGQGFARLRDAGIAIEMASEYTGEAFQLNEAFIHSMRTGRPLVTLKAALTLDGKIAAPEDNSGWITSVRARAHVQQIRHDSDAILTGIGTVLADDCLLTDRTGLERSRPLLRIVADSTLRIPLDSRIVRSAAGDVAILTTSAAPEERRRTLEYRGVRVLVFDGPGGRADLQKLPEYLAREQYRSLMIESGSKLNWAALEAGIVDKIFFYYAPKILGGLQSLPVAGGAGRLRRTDAIQLQRVKLHSIPPDEFAVEAYLEK